LKKKFVKNLFLLIILNLLIKPFWIFGIDRTVQNLVGSGEYGFYFSLFSFSLLFNIILDIGITNFNNRSLSQNPTLLKSYFSNIVVVKFMLALLYGVLTLSAALLLGYEKNQLFLLSILIFNQLLLSFLLYLRSNISGLQFYTTDSLLSVLDRIVMIVLCGLVLWGKITSHPLSIEWFVYIQTISYFIVTMIVLAVLLTKTGWIPFHINRQKILEIVRQVVPFALLGLLMSIYTRTDSVLLERLLPNGKAQAGIYAQSFRILDAASNFSLLFASLLLPMLSRLLATKEDFVPLLKTSFSILFVMCLALTLPCLAFSNEIIKTLYHEGDHFSASVFRVLILSFIPISINYIFGTLLTANGNLKLLNYAAGAAVVVNLALNFLLIGHYKALGAAYANIATQSLMVMIEIIICLRIWKFKLSNYNIIRYLLFLMLAVSGTFISTKIEVAWFLRFTGAAIFIGLSGLVTGILSLKPFYKAIKL
jgi:O-antigen/teichoic acid export membrane protein